MEVLQRSKQFVDPNLARLAEEHADSPYGSGAGTTTTAAKKRKRDEHEQHRPLKKQKLPVEGKIAKTLARPERDHGGGNGKEEKQSRKKRKKKRKLGESKRGGGAEVKRKRLRSRGRCLVPLPGGADSASSDERVTDFGRLLEVFEEE